MTVLETKRIMSQARPIPRTLSVTPDSGQIGNENIPVQPKLVDLQAEFARCVGLLLIYINMLGHKCTFGDAYDTDGDGGHMKNSNHKQRLAIDLNLFVNNAYVMIETPEYRKIGEFWKNTNALARWGGDFSTKDLNHFSFEYEGIK